MKTMADFRWVPEVLTDITIFLSANGMSTSAVELATVAEHIRLEIDERAGSTKATNSNEQNAGEGTVISFTPRRKAFY